MERYKDLVIKGDSINVLKTYVGELRMAITNDDDWKLRDDYVKTLLDNFDSEYEAMCIETPSIEYQGEILKAVIWLNNVQKHLEIVNIVPLSSKHLEFSQYNHILDVFRNRYILPYKDKFDLKIEESKSYFDMEDAIGKEAFKKLRFFSDMANKTTGYSHPLDMKRWFGFVVEVYRSGKHLSADYLMGWLEENGWSEEYADKLSISFEDSIYLLEYYDNN